ncbi:hypothetical protein PsalN5692_02654 [Piscirickettsia salmonis]|nr:hypothetical protein PsalN5692_02654 [Piscirickettsia salmonis]
MTEGALLESQLKLYFIKGLKLNTMANKLTRFIVQEIRQLRDTIQNKQENER